ncbi:MAG: anhydro-N-acetylmuramic acid kinase [Candidatus Pelagibacter sp.]
MKKKIFTALGVMTGTSMDGVDISLIKSDGSAEYTHILDSYFEIEVSLHKKLTNIRKKLFIYEDLDKHSEELIEVEREFTLFIGKILKTFLSNQGKEIDLIGFHGQTVFHNSDKKISKQLGDGKLLSQITKKIVVNNFREKDLINGGQGAPLTPIFHSLLSEIMIKKYSLDFPINIINIGGITNVTQVVNNFDQEGKNLIAFDIGPGNCLIDKWVKKNSTNKFDKDGKISKLGKVNDLILNQALDNFNIDIFDKSLDINDFDISFVKGLSLEDGCATLTKFSAIQITQGIKFINSLKKYDQVKNIICGGGRKNKSLISYIKDNLTKKNTLEMIDDYGFDGDFIESQAFAYLSVRSFLDLPISFPNTTKCKTPTVGGIVNKNF